MKKVLVILWSLVASLSLACKYTHGTTKYAPFSQSLQVVISQAVKDDKISFTATDRKLLNKIIWKENRTGNLKLNYRGHWGLGQGTKQTYRSVGLKWGTTCPVDQVKMIVRYVKRRYGTFSKAWTFHRKNNWY